MADLTYLYNLFDVKQHKVCATCALWSGRGEDWNFGDIPPVAGPCPGIDYSASSYACMITEIGEGGEPLVRFTGPDYTCDNWASSIDMKQAD